MLDGIKNFLMYKTILTTGIGTSLIVQVYPNRSFIVLHIS